ncbi:hypothetical protein [Clostridium sp. DJ247]|uniref:hypothetical protein n=1 Tax=Clostridium sp. DJ247 TaxID=2726188 RepID=UPI00162A42E2|nr:hypothetical protein [Clostridium sp. DJ247]MBC2582898.1 hypothetical protein [Clostridium sp. DJ247]
MIKINIQEDKLERIKNNHLLYAKIYVLPKLEEKLEQIKRSNFKYQLSFYKLLRDNFNTIIIGSPRELRYFVEDDTKKWHSGFLYLSYINAKDEYKDFYKDDRGFNEELSKIFDYELFKDENEVSEDIGLFSYIKKINGNIKSQKRIIQETEIIESICLQEIMTNSYKSKNYEEFIKALKLINDNYKIRVKRLYESIFNVFSWGAYSLLKEISIDTCPYCNRQYISILESNNSNLIGKTRPELDHFLCKKEFPFYAVSLFNLIPSCHVCNSNIKKDIKFVRTVGKGRNLLKFKSRNRSEDYIKVLCPYEEGFGEKYVFSIYPQDDDKEYNIFFGKIDEDDFVLKLKYNGKKDSNNTIEEKEFITKARGNNIVFRLEELYNDNHKDVVKELIVKSTIYNDSYINELLLNYSDIFNSKKQVMELLLSSYLDNSEKRPLSKLIKDISQQLGLLDNID